MLHIIYKKSDLYSYNEFRPNGKALGLIVCRLESESRRLRFFFNPLRFQVKDELATMLEEVQSAPN